MSLNPERPLPHVLPRPGVLKALGICNVVFALLSFFYILSSAFWVVMAMAGSPPRAEVKIDLQPRPGASPGVPAVAGFNPFMGMEDKNFVRFSMAENGMGLLTNALMFATGIGLINARRWGSRWWGRLAWTKIALAFAFWGYYIVGVAPGFSESMAKNVAAMFAQQGLAPGKAPSVADLTRIYAIMNLILGVGAIVASSIYPAISLWLLSRPGVKAAIVDPPSMEPELS